MSDSLSYLDNPLRKVIISVLWSTLMSNFNLRCQPKISARDEKKGQRNKCLKLLLKTVYQTSSFIGLLIKMIISGVLICLYSS